MKDQNFTTAFSADQTPEEAFGAMPGEILAASTRPSVSTSMNRQPLGSAPSAGPGLLMW